MISLNVFNPEPGLYITSTTFKFGHLYLPNLILDKMSVEKYWKTRPFKHNILLREDK